MIINILHLKKKSKKFFKATFLGYDFTNPKRNLFKFKDIKLVNDLNDPNQDVLIANTLNVKLDSTNKSFVGKFVETVCFTGVLEGFNDPEYPDELNITDIEFLEMDRIERSDQKIGFAH